MDSRFLLISAETAALKARQFRIDRKAFDVDEFLNKVKKLGTGQSLAGARQGDDHEEGSDTEHLVGEREKRKKRKEFWQRIGWCAMKHSFRVPATDLMCVAIYPQLSFSTNSILSLGPLAIEKKERKAASAQENNSKKQRKTKAQLAAEAPSDSEEVEQLEAHQITQDDKTTAKMIKVVERCLEHQTEVTEEDEAVGINLFKFFINPHDFAQSVENLFYISFLSSFFIYILFAPDHLA